MPLDNIYCPYYTTVVMNADETSCLPMEAYIIAQERIIILHSIVLVFIV